MKAAPFEYVCPETEGEALAVLAAEPDARPLAGGQSLAPLLALRLARPSVLVDVNHLDLDRIAVGEAELTIGSGVRHRVVAADRVVQRDAPLLALAARHVGDAAIRNRGTLGGSLAHADPAAELPAALMASRGRVTVRSERGTREIAAHDLFEGFFTTALEADELLVAVTVPRNGPGAGSAFEEWAPRAADFAEAGVAVTLTVGVDGVCSGFAAAACGVASVPLDLADACERAGLLGASVADTALSASLAREVTRTCAGDADRAELAGLLAARAVRRSFCRAARVAVAA